MRNDLKTLQTDQQFFEQYRANMEEALRSTEAKKFAATQAPSQASCLLMALNQLQSVEKALSNITRLRNKIGEIPLNEKKEILWTKANEDTIRPVKEFLEAAYYNVNIMKELTKEVMDSTRASLLKVQEFTEKGQAMQMPFTEDAITFIHKCAKKAEEEAAERSASIWE